MGVVIAAIVALLLTALTVYASGFRLSPDGRMYLAAGRGELVPRPFALRPLLPWVCGEDQTAWRVASCLGVVVAAACVGGIVHAQGQPWTRAVAASALFAALPIARTSVSLPVLVDGPALALTAASALLAVSGYGIASALVALVGAAVKEHVPVFAALAAWSTWPLFGIVVTALLLLRKHASSEHPALRTPFARARERNASLVLDARASILPWGACLACLFAPAPAVLASLAVAYAMTFVTADFTRVYQWAAIPVCVAAASVIPEPWLLPVVALHVANPWQGAL